MNPAEYHHQCHAGALALVREKGDGWRVARGWAKGVPSQHSWAVQGDPYLPDMILDPTIWSYLGHPPAIVKGDPDNYRPHGAGNIWKFGPPVTGTDAPITLDTGDSAANSFLEMLGPLDAQGWNNLFNGAMQGWPSTEVVEAALGHDKLRALVPIDIAGMVTDRNPQELYF